jgi:hypothetical protein
MSSVTVEINGRETVSKASQEAKQGIRDVSTETQNASRHTDELSGKTSILKNIFGSFVVTAGDVVGVLKSIASELNETLEAYAASEKAETNLRTAIQLSKNVTMDSYDGLVRYASQIQTLTGIEDDRVIALEAMLIASGRNEEQVRKLIQVSADYAAATGKDFQSTVEEINKTFSGTTGRLGQVIPELKDLTKEELENGKQLDILTEKYGGFAKQLSGETSTALAAFKAAWGDVKEALGGVVAPVLVPLLQKVTTYLEDTLIPKIKIVGDNLTEVFTNLPGISSLAFKTILEIIRNAFSWKTLGDIFSNVGIYMAESLAAAISTVPQIFIKMLSLLTNPIVVFGKFLGEVISKAIQGKWKEIPGPGDLFADILSQQVQTMGDIVSMAGNAAADQLKRSKFLAIEIADTIFSKPLSDFAIQLKENYGIDFFAKPASPEEGTGGGSGTSGSTPTGSSLASNALSPADWAWSKRFELAAKASMKIVSSASDALNRADQAWSDRYTGLAKKFLESQPPPSLAANALSISDQAWADRYTRQAEAYLADRKAKSLDFRSYAQEEMDRSNFAALDTIAAHQLYFKPNVSDEEDAAALEALGRLGAELNRNSLAADALSASDQAWADRLTAQANAWIEEQKKATAAYKNAEFYYKSSINAFAMRTGIVGHYVDVTDEKGNKSTVLQGGTQLGNMLAGFTSLTSVVKGMIDPFFSVIASLESVQAILNPVTTIFQAMMDVLGPLINTILAPIVGILRIIGTFLGTVLSPILTLFSPIITALATGFVWFYNNVMLPVGNAIIMVGNWMYNTVAKTVNTLLGWLGVHLATVSLSSGTLSELSLADLTSAGATSYSGTSGTSGSTASYTKQRDIYVYVTLNTAALVGSDGITEFALMIGRELKASGVLGAA